MDLQTLMTQIELGEDSTCQFKSDVRNSDSLAAEMAAFANSNGGMILIGVAEDGTTPGLRKEDVSRINQMISNVSSQLVRSPLTVLTKNFALENGHIIIVLTVPKGMDKPYFDKNGIIWLKAGSDKRRVNSKEELRRLFQISDQFHADELPTKAGIDKLDKLRFRDFLRDVYNQEFPESSAELTKLLQNMNLATIYPKPNTSVPNKEHEVFPYLLREMDITRPNQVLAADLTYIRMKGRHVYLIAIMDWYSRYVIHWAVSPNMEAEFCVEALRNALLQGRCEIFNTDQGSQFTSKDWINTLKDHGISISMDGRGRYLDNIFIERLWRSVKQEKIYRYDFETIEEVKQALTEYFDYYNHVRLQVLSQKLAHAYN